MSRKSLLSCFLVSFFTLPLVVKGQDIHFSQYYVSPLNLNPALTGQFDGDYRLVGNYRNQWNSITVPYRTYAFSADARNVFKKKHLHLGINAFSDDAGDSNFGTVQVNMSVAYSYPLGYDSSHFITFGLQPGFAQKKLTYNSLTFDNQYSSQLGRYDASLENGENFVASGRTYFNLGTGLSYDYKFNHTNKLTTGFSLYNLTKPKQTLFNNEQVRLNRRLTIHTNAQIRVLPLVDLLPGVMMMRQGSYKQIVFGSSGRYLLNGLTNLHLGYWYRNQDAGFVTGGITHENIYFGLSYDMNTSNLKPASNGRGGVELSLIYIIRKFNGSLVKYKACPNYL